MTTTLHSKNNETPYQEYSLNLDRNENESEDYFGSQNQFQTMLEANDMPSVQVRQQLQQKKLLEFQQLSKLQHVGNALPLDENGDLKSQELSSRYIGQRFAALKQIQQKQHYQNQLEQQYENKSFIRSSSISNDKQKQYSENMNSDSDNLQINSKSNELAMRPCIHHSDQEKKLNIAKAHTQNISNLKKTTLDKENNNLSTKFTTQDKNIQNQENDCTRNLTQSFNLKDETVSSENSEDLQFKSDENSDDELNDNNLEQELDENEVRIINFINLELVLIINVPQRMKLIDNYTNMQAQTATAKTNTSIRHGVGIEAFDTYEQQAISSSEFDIIESNSYSSPSKLFKYLLGSNEPKAKKTSTIHIEGLYSESFHNSHAMSSNNSIVINILTLLHYWLLKLSTNSCFTQIKCKTKFKKQIFLFSKFYNFKKLII